MSIDFGGLAQTLLARADSLLPSWLPGGKLRGTEFVCGNLQGDAGTSLSINVKTGVWADFAAGDKGSDLISLYAAINGMAQGDAAKALGAESKPVARLNGSKPTTPEPEFQRPPDDAGDPPLHQKHGKPVALYAYRDDAGLVGYVARYQKPDGSKEFSPWRWAETGWVAKALPKPRPLYGTERLLQASSARVLVVEGEKCVDAARDVLLPMCVVCWAGGAAAVNTADWSILAGRKVDLWPDNDDASRKAFSDLAARLYKLGCEVRAINPAGQPDKWDVADAIADGWGKEDIVKWITRDGGKFLAKIQPSAPEAPVKAAPAVPPSLPLDVGPLVAGLQLPAVMREVHSQQLWRYFGLDTSQANGVPPPNEDTVDRILSHFPGAFWFDDFLQKPMTSLGGREREMADSDFAKMAVWMQRELRLAKMKVGTVKNGIESYMHGTRRNVAQDWFAGLTWDETARLQDLLPRGFGTDDTDYYRKVGRNFIMQMVHRVIEPGCQADYMPIFEGGQGKYKSSALRIIGNQWFTEAHEEIGRKDFLQLLPGKMLIEIGELAGFSKSQIEAIKGIITNRIDRYRPSYGRLAGDYPRQCVFAGTTNRDDWNQDDTGARRFWRVMCGEIDLQWLRDNRDQLIAEALHYVRDGQEHYIVPDGEAKDLQNAARSEDMWHESITGWCAGKTGVRIEQILSSCLGIELEKQDNKAASRVRSILRLEGWVSQTIRISGRPVRAWRPPSIGDAEELPGQVDAF